MDRLLDEGGFSLLEAVLSIAVLAVFGMYILQIFAASGKADSKVRDVDTASSVSVSAVEEFKASVDPNDVLDTDFIENCLVQFGLSDYFLIEERVEDGVFDFTKGVTILKYFNEDWDAVNPNSINGYFDGDWNVASDETDNYNTDNPAVEQGVKFRLTVTVPPVTEEDISAGGQVLYIEALVHQLNKDAEPSVVTEYKTSKYFPSGGEMDGLFKAYAPAEQ